MGRGYRQVEKGSWTEGADTLSNTIMALAGFLNQQNQQKQIKKQQEQENTMKQADFHFKLMSDKNMPESVKLNSYKALQEIGAKSGMAKLPDITSWSDSQSEFGKKGSAVFKSFLKGDYDFDTTMNAITDLSAEAQSKGEEAAITPYAKRIQDIENQRRETAAAEGMVGKTVPATVVPATETGAGNIFGATPLRTPEVRGFPQITEPTIQDLTRILGTLPKGSTMAGAVKKRIEEMRKALIPEKPKEYAPELVKFVNKKGNVIDVDKNKPEDVRKARVTGYSEYKEPDTTGEKIKAGLRAWKATFKEFMGREPSKEEIRKKLINDPYGLLEPESTEEKSEMPPASQHKDRIIRDTVAGKRYKSNGSAWVEIK